MKNRNILLFVWMACGLLSLACHCLLPGEVIGRKTYEESEYVLRGEMIKDLLPEIIYHNGRVFQPEGHHVLVRVEETLKGEIRTGDTLLILQHHGGCQMEFKCGEPYLVFGRQVEGLNRANYGKASSSDELEAYSLDAPYIFALYTDERTLERHQQLSCQYPVVETDVCRSFPEKRVKAGWWEVLRRLKNR